MMPMSASAAATNPAHRRSHRSRPSCSRSCRSPPALRSAPPRAVRAAAPAAQSPRRLRSAVLAGDDFPIVNAVRFGRPDRPGRPWFSHPTQQAARGRMCARSMPFACLSASLGLSRRPHIVGPSEFRAQLAKPHRPVSPWPRMSPTAVRQTSPDSAKMPRVFRACYTGPAALACPVVDRSACELRGIPLDRVRSAPDPDPAQAAAGPGCARPGPCRAQSAPPRRSESWSARASATSASTSFPRPSRTIASRLSVARNQV